MAYKDHDEEVECEIIESYGIFSQGLRFWNKEVNLVSWNGMPAKLDIRNWQRDHKKCGKGIAITREEAEELVRLLSEILRTKSQTRQRPGEGKAGPRAGKGTRSTNGPRTSDKPRTSQKSRTSEKSDAYKKPEVPKTLEPFYKELKLAFGASPDKCKAARNKLLMKYHPDVYTGNTALATGKTIKIKEAYERIMAWWNGNGG